MRLCALLDADGRLAKLDEDVEIGTRLIVSVPADMRFEFIRILDTLEPRVYVVERGVDHTAVQDWPDYALVSHAP